MSVDISQLEKSLQAKDFTAVQRLLTEMADVPISEAEQGKSLVGFAETYVNVMNSISAEYKTVLEEAIAGMEKIRGAESKMSDKVRIAEVKSSLGK